MRGRRSRFGAVAVLAPALLLGAAVVVAEASGAAFSIARVAPVPGTAVVLEGPAPAGGAAASTSGTLAVPVGPVLQDEPHAAAPDGPGTGEEYVVPTVDVAAVRDGAGRVILVVCGDLLVGSDLEVRAGPGMAEPVATASAELPCTTVAVPLGGDVPIQLEVVAPTPAGTVVRSVTFDPADSDPEEPSAHEGVDGAQVLDPAPRPEDGPAA